ncbi:hypothetical protein JXQ31_05390 [candidate division KSB1 bacterium]|nr:hypothetical protein [candidate division KSB1 bacterium]
MKFFVYLFSAIMFLANIIQASPEIGTVEKVKEQYLLINTVNNLGDKGDKLNVYRLEGFDYRRIGRIELIKTLSNGVAAKVINTTPGDAVLPGDVLLPMGYSAITGGSGENFMAGTALEKMTGLEFAPPQDDMNSDYGSSALEKMFLLECESE